MSYWYLYLAILVIAFLGYFFMIGFTQKLTGKKGFWPKSILVYLGEKAASKLLKDREENLLEIGSRLEYIEGRVQNLYEQFHSLLLAESSKLGDNLENKSEEKKEKENQNQKQQKVAKII